MFWALSSWDPDQGILGILGNEALCLGRTVGHCRPEAVESHCRSHEVISDINFAARRFLETDSILELIYTCSVLTSNLLTLFSFLMCIVSRYFFFWTAYSVTL